MENKILIIDKFFTEETCSVYKSWIDNWSWKLKEKSSGYGEEYGGDAGIFFSSDQDLSEFHPLINHYANKSINVWVDNYGESLIYDGSELTVNDIYVHRFHGNMQGVDMGGKTYHADNTALTAVWMGSDLDDTECGFEYLDDKGNPQSIPYSFNKMILFNAQNMKHKGIPPKTNVNGPRITVACKFMPHINNPNN